MPAAVAAALAVYSCDQKMQQPGFDQQVLEVVAVVVDTFEPAALVADTLVAHSEVQQKEVDEDSPLAEVVVVVAMAAVQSLAEPSRLGMVEAAALVADTLVG